MEITVYTDGGATGNPGPGGWAAVVLKEGKLFKELSGGAALSTNNRMELEAAIQALKFIEDEQLEPTQLTICSDSRYVCDGISKWIVGWQRNGWLTASKKPVLNRELWQQLQALNRHFKPQWQWVKGHAGHAFNERCDQLVSKQRRKQSH